MSKRYMTVSDLTGDPIHDDSDVVTIIVHDHPLIDAPVQLDADAAEVAEVDGSSKDYAVIELVSDGGDKRRRLVLEVAEFDNLFNDKVKVDDVLQHAEKYEVSPQPVPPRAEAPRGRGRPRATSTPPRAKGVDYKLPENAGLVHRGRITDEEKAVVQGDLARANANRAREGQPPIDPSNAKDREKYGLPAPS